MCSPTTRCQQLEQAILEEGALQIFLLQKNNYVHMQAHQKSKVMCVE